MIRGSKSQPAVAAAFQRADRMEQAAQHIAEALALLDTDVQSEDLRDTPGRWVRALVEMTSGNSEDPKAILSKTFTCEESDELVILRDVAFTSLCEHHLLPFNGVAHVAYLPDSRVVGLSKLARLVDCFAKRLQLQERLTRQIGQAIQEHLGSKAVGCVIQAHHSCMGCRGVRKPGAVMVTSFLAGRLRESPALRAEFLSLIK